MRIGVIGSMQFTEKMLDLCRELEKLEHQPQISKFAASFIGKDDANKEKIKLKQKYMQDAIREDCACVKDMDALLVANYDKNGIANYIGGNTFLEMGYAYILGKPIYLLNPIPRMPHYETEIIAIKPMVINGKLSKIK